MKLTYTDGCICTSLDVDKKEFNIDLSLQERLDIAKKILESCKKSKVFEEVYQYWYEDTSEDYDHEIDALNEFSNLEFIEQKQKALEILESISDKDYLAQVIFIKFLESEGEYEYLGHCDECGDSICRYSITL